MQTLPSKQANFIELYSVKNCIKIFNKVETSLQAFKSGAHSLAEIQKLESSETCQALLNLWVISLNDFVNTSRKMSISQIKEACMYIYQDFHYMKMSDIYLVITRIKKGYYGQLYESIDGAKILSFFKEYSKERSVEVFNDGYREHDRIKYLDEKDRPFDKGLFEKMKVKQKSKDINKH